MAKKKTAGPDNPTTNPATTRRRNPRNAGANGEEAMPETQARTDGAPVEAVGTTAPSPTIDAADDIGITDGLSDRAGTYTPSYEEIAEAAYHRYLSRGGEHGQDFDDWLEAERELRSRR